MIPGPEPLVTAQASIGDLPELASGFGVVSDRVTETSFSLAVAKAPISSSNASRRVQTSARASLWPPPLPAGNNPERLCASAATFSALATMSGVTEKPALRD